MLTDYGLTLHLVTSWCPSFADFIAESICSGCASMCCSPMSVSSCRLCITDNSWNCDSFAVGFTMESIFSCCCIMCCSSTFWSSGGLRIIDSSSIPTFIGGLCDMKFSPASPSLGICTRMLSATFWSLLYSNSGKGWAEHHFSFFSDCFFADVILLFPSGSAWWMRQHFAMLT